MSVRTSYTISEAREMLGLWKECEKALASGQAKEYRVGTREFTALDLPEIAARVAFFGDVIESLSGQARSTRVVRIVPRDL